MLLIVFLSVFFLFASSLPVDIFSQAVLSIAVILILYLCTHLLPQKGFPRVFFIAVCTFMVLRYINWRFSTLSYDNLPSFVCSMLLFLAEFYGILTFLLSAFVNLRPVVRAPAMIPLNSNDFPTVDVFVPSYDESESLLSVTLIGALSIRYPKDKIKVYLLDDGGTVDKRNQADSVKAAQAMERHLSLQKLCDKLGVYYLTREKNQHAALPYPAPQSHLLLCRRPMVNLFWFWTLIMFPPSIFWKKPWVIFWMTSGCFWFRRRTFSSILTP